MATKKEPQKGYGEFNSSVKTNVGYLDGLTFYSKPVQYAEVDGMAVFEGDIILGTIQEVEQKTNTRGQELRGEVQMAAVITGDQFRWPNCTIPYTIDPGLPNQARVTDAIAHWQANTNVKFVLRTNANATQYIDYLTFRSSTGCSSSVGKRGGQQFVNLAANCTTGNAIHEIGHTAGLWHEQSREDRDNFVTIHWDKIIPGYENNFTQQITDGDDIGAYDYNSIMHYPRNAFSIDGTDTITPIDLTAQIGQRNGLSAGDIAAVNTIYTCGQVCKAAPLYHCPVGPACLPAPLVPCVGPKLLCPPSPRFCPPAPLICTVAPLRCPPSPRFCPSAPRLYCPPAPRVICPSPRFTCPPVPKIPCPPIAKVSGCFPAPKIGPFPGPLGPERFGRVSPMSQDPGIYPMGQYGDPYQYTPGQYGYPYAYSPAQYDPYGYGDMGGFGDQYAYPNWTAYEYPDPYQYGYQQYGYNYPETPFDPNYWGQ